MTFKLRAICRGVLLFIFCAVMPNAAFALCEELSTTQTGSEDKFFVKCTNSFAKPAYTVTEYYAGSERNSFVAYRDGQRGFMCAMLASGHDCKSLPRGGVEFHTFIMRPGLLGVIEELEKAPEHFATKDVSYSYPRRLRSALELGCFLRVYDAKKVVIGLDAGRLHAAGACLVAFERYLADNKALLVN